MKLARLFGVKNWGNLDISGRQRINVILAGGSNLIYRMRDESCIPFLPGNSASGSSGPHTIVTDGMVRDCIGDKYDL